MHSLEAAIGFVTDGDQTSETRLTQVKEEASGVEGLLGEYEKLVASGKCRVTESSIQHWADPFLPLTSA